MMRLFLKRLLLLVLSMPIASYSMEEPPKAKGTFQRIKEVFPFVLTPERATEKLRSLIGAKDNEKISLKEVKPLIDAKADKEIVGKDNKTILERAVQANNGPLVDFLLASGANPNHGVPLMHAAFNHNLAMVKRLLAAGASPNQHDEKSFFGALYHAINGENVEMVYALIMAGADVNMKIANGDTLLHVALRVYNSSSKNRLAITQIIRLLLEHGADPGIANEEGITAFEKAKSLKDKKINAIFFPPMKKLE